MASNERGHYSTPQDPDKPVTIGRVIMGGILGAIVIGFPAILLTEKALTSRGARERERSLIDRRAIRARVLARAARMDPRILAIRKRAF